MFQIDQGDAAILLNGLTVILLPFVHSWMKAKILPDWLRFIIACVVSGIGGYLSAIVTGKFYDAQSLIQTAAVISTLGAGIYIGAFGRLGLEKAIFPRADIINEAQKSVAGQIGFLSTETVNAAVDPESTTVISVRAQAAEYVGSDPSPVQPKG